MDKPTHAVIDMDMYKYSAAHVGEKKSIIVTHKTEGWSEEYKNKTEFWGHHKKKAGGALALKNAERTSPWLPEEFDIQLVQTPEPIENVLHTAKLLVEGDLQVTGAKTYEAYLGKGESFRVGLSTLMKYKGNREGAEAPPKPLALDAVTEYLHKKFKCEYVSELEADDMCVIRAYRQPNSFVIIEDKDYWGTPINVYDVNQRSRGIVDCNKLGKLFIDAKKKVRGEGRMHLYYQVISEDTIDNYKANCFSDIEWASKSAFNTLVDCKSDKECFEAMVHTFKYLYPEPKIVTGWRGDEFEIDHMYVFQEMINMAHMKRTEDESLLDVKAICDRMGVAY